MTVKTGKERQAEFRKKMKALGRKELRLWVPENKVEAVKNVANQIIDND